MRHTIHPEKSDSGNFADYSVLAGLENFIAKLPIMQSALLNPIERIDGSKDLSFKMMKTYAHRIRKKSGLIVRMSVRDDHAIIQRIK